MIKKNFQEYPLFYRNWFVFDFTETLQFLYKSQQFRYFCKKLRIKYEGFLRVGITKGPGSQA